MKSIQIVVLLSALQAGGCASLKRSVSFGVVSGAASGAASGALIAQKNKGDAAATMGIIGAILGGVSTYFTHRGIEKKAEQVRRETILNLERYEDAAAINEGKRLPKVVPPVVEQYEVGPKVKGKKFIGRHKVWVIREGAKWPLEDNDNQKSEVSQ